MNEQIQQQIPKELLKELLNKFDNDEELVKYLLKVYDIAELKEAEVIKAKEDPVLVNKNGKVLAIWL